MFLGCSGLILVGYLGIQATTHGLCLSLGLYSAGVVVSFLGLPRVGSFARPRSLDRPRNARRMAMVQGLSQVVIASQAMGPTAGDLPLQVPAVRLACQNAAWQAKEAAGSFAAHPDLSGMAARLQIEGQAVCSKVATRSIEAAQSLKQIVDDLDLNQAAEIVKEEGVAAARKAPQRS